MTLFQQALLLYILLQLLFGYFEFRYKGDIIYIMGQLFKPKYLIPSIAVVIVYVLVQPFLSSAIEWWVTPVKRLFGIGG